MSLLRQWLRSSRSSLGELLVRAAYGLQTSETGDKYMTIFEEAITSLDLVSARWNILEFFPILAKLPTWLPGTSSLRRLAHYRQVIRDMRDIPWADAKEAIVSPRLITLVTYNR